MIIRAVACAHPGCETAGCVCQRCVSRCLPDDRRKLLDSLRYGEHLVVHWVDLARYSDTYGYQIDRNRRVWRWRDFVIKLLSVISHRREENYERRLNEKRRREAELESRS